MTVRRHSSGIRNGVDWCREPTSVDRMTDGARSTKGRSAVGSPVRAKGGGGDPSQGSASARCEYGPEDQPRSERDDDQRRCGCEHDPERCVVLAGSVQRVDDSEHDRRDTRRDPRRPPNWDWTPQHKHEVSHDEGT